MDFHYKILSPEPAKDKPLKHLPLKNAILVDFLIFGWLVSRGNMVPRESAPVWHVSLTLTRSSESDGRSDVTDSLDSR